MKGLPTNIPDLEEPRHICCLTKTNRIQRGPTTYFSNCFSWFHASDGFSFFNVESVCIFTSTYVAISSATSHPIVFTSRGKRRPFEKLNFLSLH